MADNPIQGVGLSVLATIKDWALGNWKSVLAVLVLSAFSFHVGKGCGVDSTGKPVECKDSGSSLIQK